VQRVPRGAWDSLRPEQAAGLQADRVDLLPGHGCAFWFLPPWARGHSFLPTFLYLSLPTYLSLSPLLIFPPGTGYPTTLPYFCMGSVSISYCLSTLLTNSVGQAWWTIALYPLFGCSLLLPTQMAADG